MTRWSMALLVLLSSNAVRAQVFSAMEEQIQEQSEWCWAAVTTAVLNYYGGDWTQCEVAELTREVSDWSMHDFGDEDCCVGAPDTTPVACNYPNENEKPPNGSIPDLLERSSINSTFELYEDGKDWEVTMTEADVLAEAAAYRPIIMRRAYGMAGHFVVTRGMSGGMVYIMDPWPGEGFGMGTYDDMVGGGSHAYRWTSTNVLTTSPACVCSTIDACCDGCRPMNEGGSCDDGEVCAHTDVCTVGVCGGTVYTCDDDNPCTDDSCDGTGGCVTLDNTATCDDGDPCTGDDTCDSGVCVGGPAVDCGSGGDDSPIVARSSCAATGPPAWAIILVVGLLRRRG